MSLKAVIVAALCLALVAVASAQDLPTLNIDPNGVSTSGISSGGFMAVQVHFAHSKVFKGAGVIAGGPYYCAQGNISYAFVSCMYNTMPISVDSLISYAKGKASSGDIDDLSNIAGSKVWLYSGTKDTVVKPNVMHSLETMYQELNADIDSNFSTPSEHCHPTDHFGNSCSALASPYISNCNFDASGLLLSKIYGDLKQPVSAVSGNLQRFTQSKYVPGIGYSGFADDGYIYIPTACKAGGSVQCKLHFAFHGCSMTYETIGDAYVANAGYNGWAEANNIVVVYPQAEGSALKSNPQACWDWWGFTGSNYVTKKGKQIEAISNMVSKIANI